ncbi:MAG TPA: chemotaxis protein CheB [Gemmatimonadales bacterium]|nr:chemotaxis protein CheB [Gemmatimonadales bacterium]
MAIATSAGGITALHTILNALPSSLAASVLVVQHLLPDRESHLVEILRLHTRLDVRQAHSAQPLVEGTVYVAPPDAHLIVGMDRRLALSHLPPVHHCRPSGDRLFESLSAAFGQDAVAIVLTGFGRDGASGAQCVRRSGGTVIVQDPETAQFGDMPRAAVSAGAVDHILSLADIAPLVIDLVSLGSPA